jgi:hypothetical protein
VVHVHTVTVFKGGRHVSEREAMDEAVREARRYGHDVEQLELVVADGLPGETGLLHVDTSTRTMMVKTVPVGSRSHR